MILDADSNLATHSYNLRTVRAYHLKEAFQQLWDYSSPSLPLSIGPRGSPFFHGRVADDSALGSTAYVGHH